MVLSHYVFCIIQASLSTLMLIIFLKFATLLYAAQTLDTLYVPRFVPFNTSCSCINYVIYFCQGVKIKLTISILTKWNYASSFRMEEVQMWSYSYLCVNVRIMRTKYISHISMVQINIYGLLYSSTYMKLIVDVCTICNYV